MKEIKYFLETNFNQNLQVTYGKGVRLFDSISMFYRYKSVSSDILGKI